MGPGCPGGPVGATNSKSMNSVCVGSRSVMPDVQKSKIICMQTIASYILWLHTRDNLRHRSCWLKHVASHVNPCKLTEETEIHS